MPHFSLGCYKIIAKNITPKQYEEYLICTFSLQTFYRGILLSLGSFCIGTPLGIALAMGLLEALSIAGSRSTISLVSGKFMRECNKRHYSSFYKIMSKHVVQYITYSSCSYIIIKARSESSYKIFRFDTRS